MVVCGPGSACRKLLRQLRGLARPACQTAPVPYPVDDAVGLDLLLDGQPGDSAPPTTHLHLAVSCSFNQLKEDPLLSSAEGPAQTFASHTPLSDFKVCADKDCQVPIWPRPRLGGLTAAVLERFAQSIEERPEGALLILDHDYLCRL